MHSRSGLSLIELMIVIALLAIVSVKAGMVMNSAGESQSRNSAAIDLEDQSRRVLDRIAYAVMGSDRDTLFPDPESPTFTTVLSYAVSLGVEDGEIVWDDPEEIALSPASAQVVWRKKPDAPDERRVAWCNLVRPFLEGELPNGLDDNGNGLIDEQGLSFVLERNAVTIRMSLEDQIDSENTLIQTVETTVTIRN